MLTFHIGPWEYGLVIQGSESLACFEDRTIYIAAQIPPGRRLEVLLHELAHCWGYHVPHPRTEEEWANLTATIGEACRRDLEAQGGVAALRAMAATPKPAEQWIDRSEAA